MSKTDIGSMTLLELQAFAADMGLPKYRAAQLFSWLQEKGVRSFSDMQNLPKALRETLAETCFLPACTIDTKLCSALDGTTKYLLEFGPGEYVECVVMRYKYGLSICISTQLGCKMGCSFCASAIGGFKRQLTASEMLAEIHTAQKDLGERIAHVVLMGTGEPLDNYENVLRFLHLATDEHGLGLSMRHISLSTCGVVPRIYDLAKERLGLTLSVSLHAPNDAIRSALMPVNRTWGVEELLRACRAYTQQTSRRISFEYTMIDGVNDSDACAMELADKLHGMLCHVNLIPVNSVRETQYKKSRAQRLRRFSELLEQRGLTVTVRRTLGEDIDASCGQLRAKKLDAHKPQTSPENGRLQRG